MKVIVKNCCLGFTRDNEKEDVVRVNKFLELGLTGKYIKFDENNEDEDLEDSLYYLDEKELEFDEAQILTLLGLTAISALTIEVSSGNIFCM